jgi:hypothetical protein
VLHPESKQIIREKEGRGMIGEGERRGKGTKGDHKCDIQSSNNLLGREEEGKGMKGEGEEGEEMRGRDTIGDHKCYIRSPNK